MEADDYDGYGDTEPYSHGHSYHCTHVDTFTDPDGYSYRNGHGYTHRDDYANGYRHSYHCTHADTNQYVGHYLLLLESSPGPGAKCDAQLDR